MELKEKLLQMQLTLKVPKNQYNSFGKYNYRSCEDILEAVKPICADYRVLLYLSDEIVCVGNKNYIKAVATLLDIDSDSVIIVTANARESDDKKGMDDSQLSGSTSSYARKYALNAMFNIDDAKDADSLNKHGSDVDKQNEPPNPVNNQQPVLFESVKCETQGCTNLVTPTKTSTLSEVIEKSKKYYKGVYCYACRDEKYKENMERRAERGN